MVKVPEVANSTTRSAEPDEAWGYSKHGRVFNTVSRNERRRSIVLDSLTSYRRHIYMSTVIDFDDKAGAECSILD
jgi:hypothetical protein